MTRPAALSDRGSQRSPMERFGSTNGCASCGSYRACPSTAWVLSAASLPALLDSPMSFASPR